MSEGISDNPPPLFIIKDGTVRPFESLTSLPRMMVSQCCFTSWQEAKWVGARDREWEERRRSAPDKAELPNRTGEDNGQREKNCSNEIVDSEVVASRRVDVASAYVTKCLHGIPFPGTPEETLQSSGWSAARHSFTARRWNVMPATRPCH